MKLSAMITAGAALFVSQMTVMAENAETEQDSVEASAEININLEPAILGNPDAPVQIVEYASLTCGHCKHFHDNVLAELKPRIEAGEISFELREFPTAPVQVGLASYQIARCVPAEQYFDVVDHMFANQHEVLVSAQAGTALQTLVDIAKQFGLSTEEFSACASDEALFQHIVSTIEAGQERGVESTPTLFLNGEKVARENLSLEGLNGLIDAALTGKTEGRTE